MNSASEPVFAHPQDHLIPVSDHLSRMQAIPPSRMFLIKNSLSTYREKFPEDEVFDASQGDGGASLGGVPGEILYQAVRMQTDYGTGYTMPFGTPSYRRSVLEDYWQVDSDLGLSPQNVVAAAGGRDALVKAYAAMLSLGYGRQGDLILVTRVPWISYNWGPYGIGANVLRAPGTSENGWAYSCETIKESVAFANRYNRKIACMVITNPDNPTGRTLSADEQVELARCALESGIAFVFFDWIYHYVTDEAPNDINKVLRRFSPAERERVVFMDGITKSLGGSNIRNAHLIAPKTMIDFIVARSSHTVLPTYYSMAVAQAAYEMGFDRASRAIVEPTSASRKILKTFLADNQLEHIIGQGYYAFVNIKSFLQTAGWSDSESLSKYFAREYGLAMVPGIYSSPEGADWVRFSYALPPERTRTALERFRLGLSALENLGKEVVLTP